MEKFLPMKAPNEEVKAEQLKYPLLASYKLDGIRCIIKDGQMFTSHLKEFPNKHLKTKFKSVIEFTKTSAHHEIIDGELLAKSVEFHKLSGILRSDEQELPEDLFFYVFDTVQDNEFHEPFIVRLQKAGRLEKSFPEVIKFVKHIMVKKPQEVMTYFKEAVDWGCDGLILRSGIGFYKRGRGTIKEGLIYKLKPYQTFDARIIGIKQATKVDPKAEKKVNELGYSQTSKKKGDRIPIDKASCFIVLHGKDKKELDVSIAATDEEKKEIWKNQDSYIGRWVEYKALEIGMKEDGLPRHATSIRFRDDKE